MTTDVIFDGAAQAGPLPLANGDLLVLLADAEEWTPDATDATIADVDGELTGGGYTRGVMSATVDRLGDRWHAWPDSTPSITHDAPGAVWVVVARDSGSTDGDRTLVRATLVDTPTDPLEPSWPDGILTITISAGVEQIQPGAGVTVDATDPTRPIVSATGGGGGGSGLPTPIPAEGGKPLVSDGAGSAAWMPWPLPTIIDTRIDETLDASGADAGDVWTWDGTSQGWVAPTGGGAGPDNHPSGWRASWTPGRVYPAIPHLGVGSNLASAVNRGWAIPLAAPTGEHIDQIAVQVTAAGGAGSVWWIAIYDDTAHADGGRAPGAIVDVLGSVPTDSTGTKIITGLDHEVAAGQWIVVASPVGGSGSISRVVGAVDEIPQGHGTTLTPARWTSGHGSVSADPQDWPTWAGAGSATDAAPYVTVRCKP